METVETALRAEKLDPTAILEACALAERRFVETRAGSVEKDIPENTAQLYAIHLCALLLDKRYPEAKALWGRAPELVKQAQVMCEVRACARALISREWKSFFELAVAMRPPPLVGVILDALVHAVRAQGVARIKQCYTTVDRLTLCDNLGMPDSEVTQFCASMGWSEDVSSGLITPSDSSETDSSRTHLSTLGASASIAHANAQLEHLSMHVAHLEESIVLKP
eukprot:g1157.t1